jgi:hypothetical protein
MASHRGDDLNGRVEEPVGALSDNDDVKREDRATSTLQPVVRPVVDQARWHYYHLSTP